MKPAPSRAQTRSALQCRSASTARTRAASTTSAIGYAMFVATAAVPPLASSIARSKNSSAPIAAKPRPATSPSSHSPGGARRADVRASRRMPAKLHGYIESQSTSLTDGIGGCATCSSHSAHNTLPAA